MSVNDAKIGEQSVFGETHTNHTFGMHFELANEVCNNWRGNRQTE